MTKQGTISAPQHAKEGHAHNAKGRELQRRLQQTKRLRVLEKKGKQKKAGKNKETSVGNWQIKNKKVNKTWPHKFNKTARTLSNTAQKSGTSGFKNLHKPKTKL